MPTWKPANPQSKPFKCCAAWHLHRSGQCLAIYDFLGGITAGGKGIYFSSINKMAAFFDMNYEAARRCVKVLVKLGLVEKDKDGHLCYIPHDEWAKKYPNRCAVREIFPWQESTDPFVGAIWKISGGKIRLIEWQVKAVRKFIGDDDLFIREYERAIDEAQLRRVPGGNWAGTSPKAVYIATFNRLKAEKLNSSVVGIPAYK